MTFSCIHTRKIGKGSSGLVRVTSLGAPAEREKSNQEGQHGAGYRTRHQALHGLEPVYKL